MDVCNRKLEQTYMKYKSKKDAFKQLKSELQNQTVPLV